MSTAHGTPTVRPSTRADASGPEKYTLVSVPSGTGSNPSVIPPIKVVPTWAMSGVTPPASAVRNLLAASCHGIEVTSTE